jgi:pimeloyl-ACP methyl ester carboxylesterase
MPYAQLNDVKLRYAVDGDPQAPALVLSNSLGTSLEMWDPQIDRLRERFYVIRYDTRGHGQSEVTAGPYAIAQLGADVTGLLDCLSIARAHFCGLSMGGITGMWLGLHQSARIDRLVLSNTAAQLDRARRNGATRRHGGDRPGGRVTLADPRLCGRESGPGAGIDRNAERNAGRRLCGQLHRGAR